MKPFAFLLCLGLLTTLGCSNHPFVGFMDYFYPSKADTNTRGGRGGVCAPNTGLPASNPSTVPYPGSGASNPPYAPYAPGMEGLDNRLPAVPPPGVTLPGTSNVAPGSLPPPNSTMNPF